jgi:DNA adenine methylase
MKYIGSKNKLAPQIIEVMAKDIAEADCYVEPFVGGANMIDKIKHPVRIGIDGNPYLIAMWQAIQKDWEPPDTITKEQYEWIKKNRDKNFFRKEFLGFIGHNCSFSGDWFAGYAGTNEPNRNRCLEAKNNILKQKELIKDVKFYFGHYKNAQRTRHVPYNPPAITKLKSKVLYYCDPPYYEGHAYKGSTYDFNHKEFWGWCRNRARKDIVYVSDYYAPEDFKLVWEQEVTINAHQNQQKQAVERLYVVGK